MPDPADSQTKNLRKKSAALSIGAANRKVGKIMVNFLMKIVSFFLPQGDVSVSESDLRTYIQCSRGTHFYSPGHRGGDRGDDRGPQGQERLSPHHPLGGGAGLCPAIVVCANMICYGPMYSTVSVALNGGKKNVSEETAASTREFVSRVGDEGSLW